MFPFLRERPCLLIIFPILAIAGFDLLRTNGRLPRRRCRSRKQVDGGTWHHGIMMNMMIFFINIIIMMITMICHNDCNHSCVKRMYSGWDLCHLCRSRPRQWNALFQGEMMTMISWYARQESFKRFLGARLAGPRRAATGQNITSPIGFGQDMMKIMLIRKNVMLAPRWMSTDT